MQIHVPLVFIQFAFFYFSSVFECRSTGNRLEIIKPSTRSVQADFIPVEKKSSKQSSFFRSMTSSVSRANAFINNNFHHDRRPVFSPVNRQNIFRRLSIQTQKSKNKIPIRNRKFHEALNLQVAKLREKRKHRGTKAGKLSVQSSSTRAVFVPVMRVA